jgi:acyl-CoA dehydrogenase
VLNESSAVPPAGSARRAWIVDLAERIGTTVAGPASQDVDEQGRFPQETVDALRQERLLSAIVPSGQGGLGWGIRDMSDFIRVLARFCTSSALVLAMHTIEVHSLVRFGETPWLQTQLSRVVDDQILIANATSEVPGPGGGSALLDGADGPRVDRTTLACSYGLHADLIATSVRRNADAAPEDTVYVLVPTETAQLEQTSTWNTLGLRGTCSGGLRIVADVDPGAVYPTPWPTILNTAHIEVRHVLAGSAYVGIAEAALREAHAAVRAAAHRSPGTTPPSATRLAEVALEVEKIRALLSVAAGRLEDIEAHRAEDDISFVVLLRDLKVASTEVAVQAATKALQICGIRGIHREGGLQIERIIRDAHAALVMFGNDGLMHDNGATLMMRRAI